MKEKLYTIREASEILGLKEGSIRNMLSQNKIKAIKLDGIRATRISQKEIDRLTKGEQ